MARQLQMVPVAPVTQEELESAIALRNHIQQLKEMYDEQAGELLRRILSGASVDHGTHMTKLLRSQQGPVQTISLEIL